MKYLRESNQIRRNTKPPKRQLIQMKKGDYIKN